MTLFSKNIPVVYFKMACFAAELLLYGDYASWSSTPISGMLQVAIVFKIAP